MINKRKVSFIGTIIVIIAAIIYALTMLEKVGLASILALYFSGFASGATLVAAIKSKKMP
jgi:multisubunit Na+/H+ antiporter MnhG subunit